MHPDAPRTALALIAAYLGASALGCALPEVSLGARVSLRNAIYDQGAVWVRLKYAPRRAAEAQRRAAQHEAWLAGAADPRDGWTDLWIEPADLSSPAPCALESACAWEQVARGDALERLPREYAVRAVGAAVRAVRPMDEDGADR